VNETENGGKILNQKRIIPATSSVLLSGISTSDDASKNLHTGLK